MTRARCFTLVVLVAGLTGWTAAWAQSDADQGTAGGGSNSMDASPGNTSDEMGSDIDTNTPSNRSDAAKVDSDEGDTGGDDQGSGNDQGGDNAPEAMTQNRSGTTTQPSFSEPGKMSRQRMDSRFRSDIDRQDQLGPSGHPRGERFRSDNWNQNEPGSTQSPPARSNGWSRSTPPTVYGYTETETDMASVTPCGTEIVTTTGCGCGETKHYRVEPTACNACDDSGHKHHHSRWLSMGRDSAWTGWMSSRSSRSNRDVVYTTTSDVDYTGNTGCGCR
jgi:hypothetical protein